MKDNYRRREEPKPVEENEGQLEGRNALTEALRSGRTIDKVFVAAGDTDKGLQRLAAQAKEAGAVVVPVDRRKLDAMSTTRAHQGVIALEMDLEMLAAGIATLGNTGPALKNKYVLDRYGFVCLKLGQDADNIPYRRHRIPEPVYEQIGRRPFGCWMEKASSKVYLWTFASLETPRWIYAERIDLTELEKSFSSGI